MMRYARVFMIFGLVAVAKAQTPSIADKLIQEEHDREVRFGEEDDQSAIALFAASFSFSVSEATARTMDDEAVCNLMDEEGEYRWLAYYQPYHPETFAEKGITPAAAKAAGAKLGQQLVYALLARLEKNNPIKRPCGFGHCHGGMCGDGIFLVAHSYELADWTRSLATRYKLPVDLAMIDGYWMKSVKKNRRHLRSGCRRELKNYQSEKDWPDEYDEFREDCKVIIRAIHGSIPPKVFKLKGAIKNRLITIDPAKPDTKDDDEP